MTSAVLLSRTRRTGEGRWAGGPGLQLLQARVCAHTWNGDSRPWAAAASSKLGACPAPPACCAPLLTPNSLLVPSPSPLPPPPPQSDSAVSVSKGSESASAGAFVGPGGARTTGSATGGPAVTMQRSEYQASVRRGQCILVYFFVSLYPGKRPRGAPTTHGTGRPATDQAATSRRAAPGWELRVAGSNPASVPGCLRGVSCPAQATGAHREGDTGQDLSRSGSGVAYRAAGRCGRMRAGTRTHCGLLHPRS